MIIRTPYDGRSLQQCSNLAVEDTRYTDTEVPDGTYNYTVTAVFRSWSATSSMSDAVHVVSAGALSIDEPGVGYTLTATSPGPTTATSNPSR